MPPLYPKDAKAMPSNFLLIDLAIAKYFLLISTVAFISVLCLTPIVKKYTLRYGKIDLPSHRKVHRYPVVRTGGVAIFTATAIALLAAWLLARLTELPLETVSGFWILIMGSFGFFCIGLADDLMSLSALLRLFVQAVVAYLMWSAGIRVDSLAAPVIGTFDLGWLSLPVTVLWITGVVNAINWIDGLDGLAAGTCSIAASVSFVICLYIGQTATAFACAALVGSLLGFLFFNFNPAQIFMGDGGSYFVGSLLASISITGFSSHEAAIPVLFPLLILVVPLGDMLSVISVRIFRGASPFCADNRHLHHRLMKTGLTHRFTVLVIYALSCWTASLALWLMAIPGGLITVVCATGALALIGYRAWFVALQDPLPN